MARVLPMLKSLLPSGEKAEGLCSYHLPSKSSSCPIVMGLVLDWSGIGLVFGMLHYKIVTEVISHTCFVEIS